jgi:hypothetical protein
MDGRPGSNPLLEIDEPTNTLQVPALAGREPKAYKLDAVFGPNRRTEEIYDHVFSDSISRMLQGYNATIFAYGQTGSGKTHTMAGVRSPTDFCRFVGKCGDYPCFMEENAEITPVLWRKMWRLPLFYD